MIVVLDPALLLTRNATGTLPADEEEDLATVVEHAVRVCRAVKAVIPDAPSYWRRLQKEYALPLQSRTSNQRTRQGLDELRNYAGHVPLAPVPTNGKTSMWGVKALFDWNGLPRGWFELMETVLVGCAQNADETLLLTRLMVGRNAKIHSVGGSTLTEKERWRLYFHVPGTPPRMIPCVRTVRNVDLPWTSRFDERLPESGSFPFCPPEKWWLRDTASFRTVRSKTAWFDRHKNGWAQPSAGGHLHWDVFIEGVQLREVVGLDQINVTAWGTKEKGKTPGEIHHTPEDKKPHFKANARWTC